MLREVLGRLDLEKLALERLAEKIMVAASGFLKLKSYQQRERLKLKFLDYTKIDLKSEVIAKLPFHLAFESIELVRQETIRSIFENNSYLQAVVIHGYGTQGITDFGLHACDAIIVSSI